MSDPFRFDDAAYVLGSLEPAERAAFEAHLLSCDACGARVAEIADLPGVLAGVRADVADVADVADAADPGPVPDTLLPRLLGELRRRRARSRLLTAAAAGLAAAVAVVLTLLAARTPGAPVDLPSGPPQAMHALVATPVHARVALTPEKWGTRVTLHCRYGVAADATLEYEMTLHDRHGESYPLGGWRIKGGQSITYVAGAPVTERDIARIDVTTPGGMPVLRLRT